MMRHFADIIEVIGDPADQMTGFMIVEEAERELLDMIEHFFAHIGFDIDSQHMSPIRDDIIHGSVEGIDGKQGNTGNQNQRPVLAGQQIINKCVHGHRESKFQQTRTYRTGEVENKQLFVGAVIGEKTTQHLLFTLFCCNMLC
ncbi:hypothetical protein D3C75_919080 [compost metagenome]